MMGIFWESITTIQFCHTSGLGIVFGLTYNRDDQYTKLITGGIFLSLQGTARAMGDTDNPSYCKLDFLTLQVDHYIKYLCQCTSNAVFPK